MREITGTDLVPLTFRLRYEVYTAETSVSLRSRLEGTMTDAHDEHARHWAALAGNLLVASGRMCIHNAQDEIPDEFVFREVELPTPIATINRLVVKSEWRKRRLSKQIDLCRIQAARENRAACVVVSAFDWRIGALHEHGFKLLDNKWTTRGMVLKF